MLENENIIKALNTRFWVGAFMARFFPHKHKWQIRGINRYGGETYKICLKCRKTFQRVNNFWETERWEECKPIAELDNQFDSNDRFIFK
jgi:hypothetical protein